MRVGVSYWGICEGFETHRHVKLDTPDGHRYGRPIFIRELLRRGHDVTMMQERREEFGYFGLGFDEGDRTVEYCESSRVSEEDPRRFPDLDVLFLEWRWSTYKNDRKHPDHVPSKYEPDLDRQLELIEFYRGRCPIIVWDTDLKVTLEDEGRWPELILTDPSLETNRLSRDRVSLPFWTDWKELIPVAEPYPIYGYIGNNYERPDEFERFFFKTRQDTRVMGIQTSMYGNWLQRSPERESPEALIGRNREVAFNHRMNFYDSLCMMNRFLCTTHVSKPRYYETGFMSPRYLEALAVGCPAFTPRAFRGGPLLGDRFAVDSPISVVDGIRMVKSLSFADRQAVVMEQRENLRSRGKFSVDRVIDFIESGCKHE